MGANLPGSTHRWHTAIDARSRVLRKGFVAVPGGFGWDGGTGTTWRSDVDNDLTGILFTQRAMTSPEPPEAFVDFWDCAYGAMAD
jgi:CubicO group peptidase (beta-lactamase class C family)